jgi:hypothetical protein
LGVNGDIKLNSGQTVEVVVCLSEGKVEFKVDNVIKATVNDYQILKEDNR